MTCEDKASYGSLPPFNIHIQYTTWLSYTHTVQTSHDHVFLKSCPNVPMLIIWKREERRWTLYLTEAGHRVINNNIVHCKQHTYIFNTCVMISPYTNFVEGKQVWQSQWCMAQCITQFSYFFSLYKLWIKKAVLKTTPIARVLADRRAIADFETFAQLGTWLLSFAPSHSWVQIESHHR